MTSTPASAITLDEVVALSKSGVSEPVILALIDRDQTLFTLSPAQIVKLQRAGLSDTILLALIKSGHPNETPVQVIQAEPSIGGAAPAPPTIAVVGHGPDVPNTPMGDAMAYRDSPAVQAPLVIAVPIMVPVPYSAPHTRRRLPQPPERTLERTANPLLCAERIATGTSPFAPALTRVTECPPAVQRYPVR